MVETHLPGVEGSTRKRGPELLACFTPTSFGAAALAHFLEGEVKSKGQKNQF